MNPGAIVWQCHACGEIRDDDCISVAHLKVPIFGALPAVQLNARYCNDRSRCLAAVADVLEAWAKPLRVAGLGERRATEVDRHWEIPIDIALDRLPSAAPAAYLELHRNIRAIGGELCVSESSSWVVVPMFRPCASVWSSLRGVDGIVEIGDPVRFEPGT